MLDLFMNLPNETKFFIAVIFVFALIFHIAYNKNISEKAPTFFNDIGNICNLFCDCYGLIGV